MSTCPSKSKYNFFAHPHPTVLNIKDCISKLSIKMFMKRKTNARKAYAYRMPLIFKTFVTYQKRINLTPDNCVRCEVTFVGHNLIFCRTLSDAWCSYSGLLVFSKYRLTIVKRLLTD